MFATIPLEETLTLELSMYMCMCVTVYVVYDYVCMWVVYMWPCVWSSMYMNDWVTSQDKVWYSPDVIMLFYYQSLCHINTSGLLKQLIQCTTVSLHTHNIATHIFATSHNCWTSSLGRYWWWKLQRLFLLYKICEPGEICISAPVTFIIDVTQPVITRHTLYPQSTKDQANFMYMISILVGPVTTRCKSLCDWVGHGLAALIVLYHILQIVWGGRFLSFCGSIGIRKISRAKKFWSYKLIFHVTVTFTPSICKCFPAIKLQLDSTSVKIFHLFVV